MGAFLQKTNIIRDFLEDLVEGRAFWPREVWEVRAGEGGGGESGGGQACDPLPSLPRSSTPPRRRVGSRGCARSQPAGGRAVTAPSPASTT